MQQKSTATALDCMHKILFKQRVNQNILLKMHAGRHKHLQQSEQGGALFTLWMGECVLSCCDVNGQDECERQRAEMSGGQLLRRLLSVSPRNDLRELCRVWDWASTSAHENISRPKFLIKKSAEIQAFFPPFVTSWYVRPTLDFFVS